MKFNSELLFLIGLLIYAIVFLSGPSVSAQETVQHETHESSDVHSVLGARLTAIIGYSLIDNSFLPESNDILIVPTIGLNFDYYLTEKSGMGFHSDILLQQFKVQSHNGQKEIVRENPVTLAAMGLFKPHEKWTVILGYGVELEKNESFQLIRIGGEYGIPLPKHWEVVVSMEYDYKINNYSVVMFGMGFSLG